MSTTIRILVGLGFLSVVVIVGLTEAQARYSELYAFQGGNDGQYPAAGLYLGGDGNFYGTTAGGGGYADCAGGCGTIYSLTPKGAETVLYAFQGGSDGGNPEDRAVADGSGNFYGKTNAGGAYDK